MLLLRRSFFLFVLLNFSLTFPTEPSSLAAESSSILAQAFIYRRIDFLGNSNTWTVNRSRSSRLFPDVSADGTLSHFRCWSCSRRGHSHTHNYARNSPHGLHSTHFPRGLLQNREGKERTATLAKKCRKKTGSGALRRRRRLSITNCTTGLARLGGPDSCWFPKANSKSVA